MLEIPLNKGLFALIDDEDLGLIAGYTWTAHVRRHTTYAITNVGGRKNHRQLLMHRVILGLGSDDPQVDHRDRNGLNNQRNNLRLATTALNAANTPARSASGFKGVYRAAHGSPGWQCLITINRRVTYIGTFADPVEAARAYDIAAQRAFGEYAQLNFPKEG